jgi:hypothetical protein
MAKENFGENAGLVAAAALAIDYILNAAVLIWAGVCAIVSAVPRFSRTRLCCVLPCSCC